MINELNNHKKNDFIKWIITFTMITLLAISVIAIGANVFGKGNNEVITEKDTNITTPDADLDANEPTTADGLSTVRVVDSELMALSAMAYSTPATYANNQGIRLTATLSPASAATSAVEWTAAWVNPSSAFASGKDVNDYITITIGSSNNIVYVSANEAFGEQIKIIATSVVNPSVSAYCLVDYGQKLSYMASQKITATNDSFIPYNMLWADMPTDVNLITPGTASEMYNTYHVNGKLSYTPTFDSTYTIANDNFEYYYSVSLYSGFVDALEAAGLTVTNETVTIEASNFTVATLINALGCGKILPTSASDTVDFELLNTFNTVCSEFTNVAFYVTAHVTSGYDSGDFMFYCQWVNDDPTYAPTSMTISDSNIIL